jgi:hypothetical protein
MQNKPKINLWEDKPSAAREVTLNSGMYPNAAGWGGMELTYPARLVFPSSWVGHIPFAFWLVEALRPRVIIELGVHSGNSYCAFLQAVRELGLETRCFGIDHWKGDEHAGFYGEDVYSELRNYHDPLYGDFSVLMRCSFEEALPNFLESTIDLLHIDGCHMYDAARKDFEGWRSKLSSRAVVLLHDTNVRERGFGIWRLWEELTSQYPGFEFLHSHGLGIAYVGSEPLPSTLHPLFDVSTGSDIARIRTYFGRLGTSVFERWKLLQTENNCRQLAQDFDAKVVALQQEVDAAHVSQQASTASLNGQLAQANAHIAALQDELKARVAGFDELAKRHSELEAHVANLTQELQRLQQASQAEVDSRRALEAESHGARAELQARVAEFDELAKRHRELEAHVANITQELQRLQQASQAEVDSRRALEAQLHGTRAELQAREAQAQIEAQSANAARRLLAQQAAASAILHRELVLLRANPAAVIASRLPPRLQRLIPKIPKSIRGYIRRRLFS